jgi:hypothetical protein
MEESVEMSVLERAEKAFENFTPRPFSEVDKRLRKATVQTGEDLKADLQKVIDEIGVTYA